MTFRAFVAGATGYTGREVVSALVAHGAGAIAHVRPDSPALARWRDHFGKVGAEVDTTPWSESAVLATLARRRPTHVFALLGTTRKRARQGAPRAAGRESYEAVDYGLTAMLLRAAVDSGLTPHFTYLSAIGADARSPSEYIRVRGRLEAELTASGLPFLIARPSFITGPDREESRPMERLAARVVDGVLGAVRMAGGRTVHGRYASMSGTELAGALVRLALAPAGGRTVADGATLRASRRGGP